MTRREFVVGSGAAACVAAVAGCRTAARQAAEDAAQRELEKQVDDGLIAGGVCAVVGGDVHVAGKMRRPPMSTPMRADALFDLASAAKPFTASLCAILYTQGRLDPDAPFTEYLPQHVLAKENHGITVRDLATHSGGFDNSKPYIFPDANEFNRRLYQKRPVRPRGEKYDYACSNMIYLGRIVENLTGLDLETAAMRMLWEPLGMRDTFWHNIPGNVRAVETEQNGHPPIGVKGDEQARAYPGAMGNGAAFSCVGDMLKFVDDLRTRDRFPKAYYDLLFTCCYEKDGARRSFGWDMCAARRPAGWSEATVCHGGYTGNTIAVDPANGFAGVVLTNRTGDRLKAYAGHGRLLSLMSGCGEKG